MSTVIGRMPGGVNKRIKCIESSNRKSYMCTILHGLNLHNLCHLCQLKEIISVFETKSLDCLIVINLIPHMREHFDCLIVINLIYVGSTLTMLIHL